MPGVSSKAGLVGLTFQVAGIPALTNVLGAMMSAVKDLRPVWDDIADDFVKSEARLFQAQGEAEGFLRWEALSKEYAAWKKRKGFSPKIMVATGRLMYSLTERGARDFIYAPAPLRLTIGTRVPYAIYHQDPQAAGRKKRPMVVVTKAQMMRWSKLIHVFLVQSGQLQRPPRVSAPSGGRIRAQRRGGV